MAVAVFAIAAALVLPSVAGAGVSVFIGSATIPVVPELEPTANLWVDTDGGTCFDSSTEIEYVDGSGCSWDGANDACEGGDTVGVVAGNYGNVTLTGSNGRASACTFEVASGQATLGEFNNGSFTGGDTGADWITIDGGVACTASTVTCGVYTTEFDSDNTANVTIIGWEIDGQDAVLQLFHIDPVTDFTVRDSHIHNACAASTTGAMTYTSQGPVTFDNNDFHDANVCSLDEPHTECVFATSVSEITFTRNRVYRCNAQGLFFTGDADPSGLIENNYFGRTCQDTDTSCDAAHGAPNALHFRSGGEPSPSPDDLNVRYNTFRGNFSLNNTDNPPGAGGLRVTGNVFLAEAACGLSNTTYSYNLHVSGSCGGTGTVTDADALTTCFADPSDLAASGGDWSLVAGCGAIGAGNDADHPAADLAGTSRSTDVDIGAYEFAG